MTNKRFCILCGKPFESDDPKAQFCPEHRPAGLSDQIKPGPTKPASKPAPTPELTPGQTLLDTYQVIGLLGAGGMGKVYRVHHTGWNMDLAVKQPLPDYFKQPEDVDNFIREAETWVNLGLHPHITSCYYVRTIDAVPNIFVELMAGGSLEHWIRRDGHDLYAGSLQDSLARILDIAIQFAWGLAYAHQQGLVHRDVKPLNVLMTPDGIAKVTDFGLAKARAAAGESPEASSSRALGSEGLCTREYRSPEQARHAALDLKTDLWSWGVSVLQMFAGEVFWLDGQGAADTLTLFLQNPQPAFIPAMPEALVSLLRQCFAPNPADRPDGMESLTGQLAQIYRRETGLAYPREKPDAAELQAGSLNNKALSLLDLGKVQSALECWDQALQEDPAHVESNLNLMEFRWRKAEITDDEVLAHLTQISGGNIDSPAYWIGMAYIHAERGDLPQLQACRKQISQLDPHYALPQEKNVIDQVKVLQGHQKQIFTLQVHPNGELLASAGSDETIRLWDIRTGKCLSVYKDAGFTTSVAFSPSGAVMVSGSADHCVRVWDLAKNGRMRKLAGHRDVVTAVAVSNDGQRVISGSLDGTARVWQLSSGQCQLEYEEHHHWVLSIQVPQEGSLALTAGRDQTVRLWDQRSGKTLRVYERPRSPRKAEYGSVSLKAGKVLWAGYECMALWDYASGQRLTDFISCQEKGAIEPYMKGDLSNDGRVAVTVGQKGEKRFWDTGSGRCLSTFTGSRSAGAVHCGPDGTLYFGVGPEIEVWKVQVDPGRRHFHPLLSIPASTAVTLEKQSVLQANLALAKGFQEKGQPGKAVEVLRKLQADPGFRHDDNVLDLLAAAAMQGQKVSLREGWIHSSYHLEKMEGVGGVTALQFASEMPLLAAGHRDGTIHCYDIQSRTRLAALGRHIGEVAEMAFLSPQALLSLSRHGDLILWDTSRAVGQLVNTGREPKGAHLSVLLDEAGRFIILQGMEGFSRLPIRLENTAILPERAFKPLAIRADIDPGMPAMFNKDMTQTGYMYRAAVSPDGSLFTSSMGDSRFGRGAHPVFVWHVAHAGTKLLRRFVGHHAPVLAMAFSRDQAKLATADASGRIVVWDVPGNAVALTLQQPKTQFRTVAMTPDGNFIAAGDSQGQLFLWDQAGKLAWTAHSHQGAVKSLAFSADGRFAASGGYDNQVLVWELDWEYRFPRPADWDEGARGYLEVFLNRHRPVSADQKIPQGSPSWREDDLNRLLTQLGNCGYGWLRKEGVEKKLRQMPI